LLYSSVEIHNYYFISNSKYEKNHIIYNAHYPILLTLVMTHTLIAQGLLYEVPMNQQVQASSQIVEGKVVSKESFWDVNHQKIYTVNTIAVYKVFKGQTLSTINVVTQGGIVGLHIVDVNPSLRLDEGDIGVFMPYDNFIQLEAQKAFNPMFLPYSGPQGFYAYNLLDNKVRNPFYLKNSVSDNFYNELTGLTKLSITEVSSFNINEKIQAYNQTRSSINITSFTPTTATAGTKTVVTINGAGFGATQQNVGFLDANGGGANSRVALQSQIISWSDTQIEVEVPSRAGTGAIAIIDNPPTALLAVSGSSLTVPYAQINFDLDNINPGTPVAYNTQHVNQNGTGGYVWQMNTAFDANTAANASFIRALGTWRCESGIHWTVDDTNTTSINIAADDDVNVISFDVGSQPVDGGNNPNALAAGVLGACTTYAAGCIVGGTIDLIVSELDILFDDTQSWEFGPAPAVNPNFDFETVTVHELGHGHQLAHVIATNKIMHFAIGPGGNNRTLHPDDIAGSGDVFERSSSSARCNAPLMTAFDCATLSSDDVSLSDNISLYPNPTKNNLNILTASNLHLEFATIFDVRGRQVFIKNLNAPNSLNTIDVSQLHTGVYFIKIDLKNSSTTKKFIVE
jgi:hypothetical protein